MVIALDDFVGGGDDQLCPPGGANHGINPGGTANLGDLLLRGRKLLCTEFRHHLPEVPR